MPARNGGGYRGERDPLAYSSDFRAEDKSGESERVDRHQGRPASGNHRLPCCSGFLRNRQLAPVRKMILCIVNHPMNSLFIPEWTLHGNRVFVLKNVK